VKLLGPLLDTVQTREGGRRLAHLTSRLTSAASLASATFTSTGMVVTLLPNKTYRIRAFGAWNTSATASTWAPRFNFSGTTTSCLYTLQANTSATALAGSTVVANATAFTTLTAATAALNLPFRLEGTLVVGASGGNLTLEHSRVAGSGTITIPIGSMLEAIEAA
jgi:hypothetical protein